MNGLLGMLDLVLDSGLQRRAAGPARNRPALRVFAAGAAERHSGSLQDRSRQDAARKDPLRCAHGGGGLREVAGGEGRAEENRAAVRGGSRRRCRICWAIRCGCGRLWRICFPTPSSSRSSGWVQVRLSRRRRGRMARRWSRSGKRYGLRHSAPTSCRQFSKNSRRPTAVSRANTAARAWAWPSRGGWWRCMAAIFGWKARWAGQHFYRDASLRSRLRLGREPGAPPSQRHARSGHRAAPDARLLLVEDNLVNQKVVLAILRKKGYQIDVANDGREALKKLEAWRALRSGPDGCADAGSGRPGSHAPDAPRSALGPISRLSP